MERTQQIDDFFENLPQHYQKLERYIFSIVYCKETASDLTQDTFLRMLEKLDQFDPQKANLNTWAYTIARNLAYSNDRRYRTRTKHLPELRARTQTNPTPEEIISCRELLDIAYKNLNQKERDLVKLVGEGYKPREIGEQLGISTNATKLRTYRTRVKIKSYC